jgi:hypothetical protein
VLVHASCFPDTDRCRSSIGKAANSRIFQFRGERKVRRGLTVFSPRIESNRRGEIPGGRDENIRLSRRAPLSYRPLFPAVALGQSDRSYSSFNSSPSTLHFSLDVSSRLRRLLSKRRVHFREWMRGRVYCTLVHRKGFIILVIPSFDASIARCSPFLANPLPYSHSLPPSRAFSLARAIKKEPRVSYRS